jgi:hypothetical protein
MTLRAGHIPSTKSFLLRFAVRPGLARTSSVFLMWSARFSIRLNSETRTTAGTRVWFAYCQTIYTHLSLSLSGGQSNKSSRIGKGSSPES